MGNKNAMVIMNKNDKSFLKVIGVVGLGAAVTYLLKKYVIDEFNDDECFGLRNTDDSIFDFEKYKEEYDHNN